MTTPRYAQAGPHIHFLAQLGGVGADFGHVAGLAHEGGGDVVHVVLDAPADVHLVLVAHRRQVHWQTRHVHACVALNDAIRAYVEVSEAKARNLECIKTCPWTESDIIMHSWMGEKRM
jgi:hypothetical protein